MSSPAASIPGSDAGTTTPSLQRQASLTASHCKCDPNKTENPKLALVIHEEQDDVFSDSAESLFEPGEDPSIKVKALRARQYLRRYFSLDEESDHCKLLHSNWEAVKHAYSFLYIMGNLFKQQGEEEIWPVEWEDESTLTLFIEKTVATWMEDLSDQETADIEDLAEIMGKFLTIDPDDDASISRYQRQLDDCIADLRPVTEIELVVE